MSDRRTQYAEGSMWLAMSKCRQLSGHLSDLGEQQRFLSPELCQQAKELADAVQNFLATAEEEVL